MCEKLNEYIDKTKEAEQALGDLKAISHGRERAHERVRAECYAEKERADRLEQRVREFEQCNKEQTNGNDT
jgi:hypothetical protein